MPEARRLRVAFAGTPEFAQAALTSLLDAGFNIVLVLTQPDRPAGRGMKLQASAVKALAVERGIPVEQPRSLKLDGKFAQDALAAQHTLVAAQADVMVVAAYGLILPAWVLQLPRLGCLNIHASLLPRWRGAAPIHRAIEAGDAQTGITIMQMDAGLDTGAMLLREPVPIGAGDSTATLHDRLALLGGRLIVQALALAAGGGLVPTPQPCDGATYAHKIEKSEAAIDWCLPAAVIERRMRAFDPFPGASTTLGELSLKCWRAELCIGQAAPGQVLAVDDAGITVACGHAALRLTELQRPGGKRIASRQFLQGTPIGVGMVFGPAAG
jgi:methionyl-tRNA formyltransferase